MNEEAKNKKIKKLLMHTKDPGVALLSQMMDHESTMQKIADSLERVADILDIEPVEEKKESEKVVVEFPGAEMIKGEPGKPGETPSDEKLLGLIKPLIPEVKNGETPSDEKLLGLIKPLIPQVKNGETPSDEKLLKLIKKCLPKKSELIEIIKPLIPEVKNGETPSDEKLKNLIRPFVENSKITSQGVIDFINTKQTIEWSSIRNIPYDVLHGRGNGKMRGGGISEIVAGANISVDLDPTNKSKVIISATGGGSADPLELNTLKAKTSAGLLLEASNGTDVGLFGAGNTSNVTWYGSHNFDSLSANTIPYLGSSKTLSTNASRFTINPTLWYFGHGVQTPTAVGHFAQTTNETATAPTSVTATAVLQTRDPAPTSSNIISTVYQTDVPQGLSIGTPSQNTGSGNYIANGQTINYTVWAYKDVPDGASTTRVFTQGSITSFTDTINDGVTPFTVSVSWSISSGIADGYIIFSDNAGSSSYASDVGTDTSAEDDGTAFTTGSGTSSPSGSFFLVSTGGTRNIRARAFITPPIGSTQYYTDAYDYTVTEPTSGENYIIYHEVLSMGSYVGSIQIYGANDGSVTYTGSYQFSSGSLLETDSFWGSGGITQTPTDWTNITGSGQTLKYKARTRVISGGFGYYYSSNESNEASVVVPNTGSKYYIQISGVAGTSTTPSASPSNFGYRLYKAAPTSYTETTTQSPTLPISALLSYDTGSNFSTGTEATPTSWIASAALFESQGFGDPLATGANYSLQGIFKSTSSSQATCGYEFRDSNNGRMGAIYSTSNVLNIVSQNSTIFKTVVGTQLLSLSFNGQVFGTTSTNLPVTFSGNSTIGTLAYINQTAMKFVVGSTTGSGFFNIIGHSSMTTPIMYVQHAGTGNIATWASSGGNAKVEIDPTGNLKLNAGFGGSYTTKTSTYTLVKEDNAVDCTSGTFTVTLPSAGTVGAGHEFTIINTGTGVITVATTSSQTINEALTVVLGIKYASITVKSTGSGYIRIK